MYQDTKHVFQKTNWQRDWSQNSIFLRSTLLVFFLINGRFQNKAPDCSYPHFHFWYYLWDLWEAIQRNFCKDTKFWHFVCNVPLLPSLWGWGKTSAGNLVSAKEGTMDASDPLKIKQKFFFWSLQIMYCKLNKQWTANTSFILKASWPKIMSI